jgi:hypothetical protein
MTTREATPTCSRVLKTVTLLLLATVVLAVAGCGDGDSEAAAVCDSLETLRENVDGLRDLELEDEEAEAVAELEESLTSIQTDLGAVQADAQAELSQPLAGVESALETLTADIAEVRAAGDITAESAQGLVASVAAVGTAWEVLKSSVPDCDL